AARARAIRRAAGRGQARGQPRRPAAGTWPEGIRSPRAPAGRPWPGGLRRGTAGEGVGRDGRPVYLVGQGHHQQVAAKARSAAGDRDRLPGRLPDRLMTASTILSAFRPPARGLWPLRRTVRLRLTVVYGGLFLLTGAALLAITYLLVSRNLPSA